MKDLNIQIKQLKRELGLTNKDLAEFFNMSYDSYSNSSAKKRYERAMCSLYNTTKTNKQMKEAQNFLNDWVNDVSNESVKGEYLEYSEREVVEMLHDYTKKLNK